MQMEEIAVKSLEMRRRMTPSSAFSALLCAPVAGSESLSFAAASFSNCSHSVCVAASACRRAPPSPCSCHCCVAVVCTCFTAALSSSCPPLPRGLLHLPLHLASSARSASFCSICSSHRSSRRRLSRCLLLFLVRSVPAPATSGVGSQPSVGSKPLCLYHCRRLLCTGGSRHSSQALCAFLIFFSWLYMH